jgi:hypothetical protein
VLERGGIKAVAAATGTHPDTVARGVQDLEGIVEPVARVRLPGGGRKKLSVSDPQLMAELKALVDPETWGDPMSLLVWTTKSTRNLAEALTQSEVYQGSWTDPLLTRGWVCGPASKEVLASVQS